MAGNLKQLKENLKYLYEQFQKIGPEAAEEMPAFQRYSYVERRDVNVYPDFMDNLGNVLNLIIKIQEGGKFPEDKEEENKIKINIQEICNKFEKITEKMGLEDQTKRNTILIENLKEEIIDFKLAFGKMGKTITFSDAEKTMLDADLKSEKFALKAAEEKIANAENISMYTDRDELNDDVNYMKRHLKSVKSIFLKNSPYFEALERSLNALGKYIERLPENLSTENMEKVAELYHNAYTAANAYINRADGSVARGSRMQMVIELRSNLRNDVAIYQNLIKKEQKAEMTDGRVGENVQRKKINLLGNIPKSNLILKENIDHAKNDKIRMNDERSLG